MTGALAVVVMGVAGSGKSTIGTLLAAELGVRFADADDFHTAQARAQMAAGRPLDDEDRQPWLAAQARWLAEQRSCVLACSALKRRYRDVLRGGRPDLWFLHLSGDPAVVADRIGARTGHFMPVSLVGSQYADLEPLEPDERGCAIAFTEPPDRIIAEFLARVEPWERGQPGT